MLARQALLYFAWSRLGESHAPLLTIEDRFPAIFELRRLFYPKFEALSDRTFDQGIAGFLDHVQKPNFQAFCEQTQALTGRKVTQLERSGEDNVTHPLDSALEGVDSLVIISYDSFRTAQTANASEIAAVHRFLEDPDHVAFICPHHDIGDVDLSLSAEQRLQQQLAEYRHHGDHAIPPRQGFGGFARSLLAGLGVPVENRFGLRPALTPEAEPAPLQIERELDELNLLSGVESFNTHPHLPHLERIGASAEKMQVLARQQIDPSAPPHAFSRGGRLSFDSLLQSHRDTFAGKLLVCDTTLFSSTAGGVENLQRFWSNFMSRSPRAAS